MSSSTSHAGRIGRGGRPLVYSLTETVVFILIAAALIATAAVPAVMRHPQVARAQTVASARLGH